MGSAARFPPRLGVSHSWHSLRKGWVVGPRGDKRASPGSGRTPLPIHAFFPKLKHRLLHETSAAPRADAVSLCSLWDKVTQCWEGALHTGPQGKQATRAQGAEGQVAPGGTSSRPHCPSLNLCANSRRLACTQNTCYLNQEPCRVWGVLGRAAQLWTQGQLVPSFCRYDLASFPRLP